MAVWFVAFCAAVHFGRVLQENLLGDSVPVSGNYGVAGQNLPDKIQLSSGLGAEWTGFDDELPLYARIPVVVVSISMMLCTGRQGGSLFLLAHMRCEMIFRI